MGKLPDPVRCLVSCPYLSLNGVFLGVFLAPPRCVGSVVLRSTEGAVSVVFVK